MQYDYLKAYRSRPSSLSVRLPLIQEVYRHNVRKLWQASHGTIVKTTGYLHPFNKSISKPKLGKWSKKYNLGLDTGYELYKFLAELSGIDTCVLVISPSIIQPKTSLPYEFTLLKLGCINTPKTQTAISILKSFNRVH